jgi:hypothetical protein
MSIEIIPAGAALGLQPWIKPNACRSPARHLRGRTLNGGNSADLPVEQPTTLELVTSRQARTLACSAEEIIQFVFLRGSSAGLI